MAPQAELDLPFPERESDAFATDPIARRLQNPATTGALAWRPFPGAWGLRGLPVTFTDAKGN